MDKPHRIDPRADKVLELLAGESAASEIVLGGYFALRHYIDYRQTHDIDAWWKTRVTPGTEELIRLAMRRVSQDEGCEVRERRFGETTSFELVHEGKRQFSFQIAVRSVGLQEPVLSPWPPILIETLADNLASKMNALVDRGAPRDFLDIKHVIDAGLVTVEGVWELWRKKNLGQAAFPARQKVLVHLASLEMRRPLDSIEDPGERERARLLREWFQQEFLPNERGFPRS
ncbi:MAG: hypothetical protein NVSMB9_34730 [Isosphaeraceae bacterium]